MIALRPISEFRNLSIDEFHGLCKESVKLQKKAKDATAQHTQSFPALGKLYVVAAEKLLVGKQSGAIPRTVEFPQYWENTFGQKPNNHAQSCSVVFDVYVRNAFIEEPVYDNNTNTNLELSASISTAVGHDITHTAIKAASDILKGSSKDVLKTKSLRALLDTVKPGKPLDADKAAEMLKAIFAMTGGLELTLGLASAEIAYQKDETTLKCCFAHLNIALDHCGTSEMQAAWIEEKCPQPVAVIKATEQWVADGKPNTGPVETPAVETPVAVEATALHDAAPVETPRVETPPAPAHLTKAQRRALRQAEHAAA